MLVWLFSSLLALAGGDPKEIVPGTIPTDGSTQNYEDFTICWPEGYTYNSRGKEEDDRTVYSIGEQTDDHWVSLRVDTLKLGGVAGLFSADKVYSIAQGRVLKQMRKNFPNLELSGAGSRVIGGVPFHGAQLLGTTRDGKLPVEIKLFLNKRGSKLYIITAMEVSHQPGPELTNLANALDTFEFPDPSPKK